MRICIIAPTYGGEESLDQIPEYRAIMSRHTSYLLAGEDVTVKRVFEVTERFRFDVIHYSAHAEDGDVILSNAERLTPRDCAQIARTTKALINVFTSCRTGSMASYVTGGHGVLYAFYANKDITDIQAWKFALTLYNELENSHVGTVLEAFRIANDGDGTFGWTMDIELALEMLKQSAASPIRPFSLETWQLLLILSIGAVSLILSILAIMR